MIGQDATDGNWVMFIDTWTHYKEMCELTDLAVIQNEPRMVCTPKMNRLLFNLVGAETFNSATEE